MRFLALSAYKVQNRLPSRTPASNCVRAWTDTNNANEPPRFPQQEAGAVFYTKKEIFFCGFDEFAQSRWQQKGRSVSLEQKMEPGYE